MEYNKFNEQASHGCMHCDRPIAAGIESPLNAVSLLGLTEMFDALYETELMKHDIVFLRDAEALLGSLYHIVYIPVVPGVF